MRELFIATRNKGKLKEFEALFSGVIDRLLSPADIPDVPEVEEDGASFQENAVKKARSAALVIGKPALADD
jgi:XTP/dITP diphosphohydrolase